jgi:hypothetical protein
LGGFGQHVNKHATEIIIIIKIIITVVVAVVVAVLKYIFNLSLSQQPSYFLKQDAFMTTFKKALVP